jgi:NAD(P)-dependent dehydrogenase (short-subunit alcohol dehydrogenase family)
MRVQGYGRIVFTSSGSGLYGNFGQANYGAAKAAMVGLMNVLHLEGMRDDIRVNTLAPTAATRMTQDLLPPEALPLLAPETITPGLLYLVSDDAPSRVILSAGAGTFAVTRITETQGVTLQGADNTPENVAAQFAQITDPGGAQDLPDAFSQTRKYAVNAAQVRGLDLPW